MARLIFRRQIQLGSFFKQDDQTFKTKKAKPYWWYRKVYFGSQTKVHHSRPCPVYGCPSKEYINVPIHYDYFDVFDPCFVYFEKNLLTIMYKMYTRNWARSWNKDQGFTKCYHILINLAFRFMRQLAVRVPWSYLLSYHGFSLKLCKGTYKPSAELVAFAHWTHQPSTILKMQMRFWCHKNHEMYNYGNNWPESTGRRIPDVCQQLRNH